MKSKGLVNFFARHCFMTIMLHAGTATTSKFIDASHRPKKERIYPIQKIAKSQSTEQINQFWFMQY